MPCLIYGNGAMARVVLAYVRRVRDVPALTVAADQIGASQVAGLPVIPFEDIATHYPPDTHEILVAVGYNQLNRMRGYIAGQCEAKGYRLASYVDPWARLHEDVVVGKNCVILDFTTIHPNSVVGDHCFLSSQVNVGHDNALGAGAWFNAGVKTAGFASLGARTVWGMNAICGDHVTVGAESLILAQAGVIRSIPARSVMMPASPEPSRFDSVTYARLYGPWQGADVPCPA